MPKPEAVNPKNFETQQILYSDGEFSIAWGKWRNGSRYAMGWK